MKNNTVLAMVCFLISMSLTACGDKTSAGNGSSATASLDIKGTSGNAVNMNGTWTVPCEHSTADNLDILRRNVISGSSVIYIESQWIASTTANCTQNTTPSALFKVTTTASTGAAAAASWTDGGSSTLPPTGISKTAKATLVTQTFKSVTVTPGTSQVAVYYNSIALCGKTDYAAGVEKEVFPCAAIGGVSSTATSYVVVDDAAAVLKSYSGEYTTPYLVDSTNPMSK